MQPQRSTSESSQQGEHAPFDLAASNLVAWSTGNDHRPVDQRAGNEVARGLDVRHVHLTRGSGPAEPVAQKPYAVFEIEGTPRLPAQDRRPVDKENPL